MIELKVDETGDAYLEKHRDVIDRLSDIIDHSLGAENEQVLIETSFLKDVVWLLIVGYKAYLNNSNDDLHEISKTLKEMLREMRKRKV